MKSFQEFISEATIQQLRARANAARQKGDMETFIALQKQASELGAGTQAKISAIDKPKKPSDPNSMTGGGYAQTGRRGRTGGDPASSVGTVSGSRRRRVVNMRTGSDLGPADPSDVRISGRFGTTPGGRGTGISRSGGKIGA